MRLQVPSTFSGTWRPSNEGSTPDPLQRFLSAGHVACQTLLVTYGRTHQFRQQCVTSAVKSEARAEIEALHEFFVGWFSGALPKSAFEISFRRRFAENLLFIPPAGFQFGLSELSASVERAHGSNPAFRIAIRNVKVHLVFPDHILATYEEWQRNALASTPPNNGRVATVVFERAECLRWLHIHETWMPPEQMAAGPYNF